MPRLALATFLIFLILGLPGRVAGQSEPQYTVSAADSVAILAAARSDQSTFERLRRNRLPERWGSGSTRCDERIGRFCLTHGAAGSEWVTPPEHDDVVISRGNLVDGLSQVAVLMPGDGWVAGQLVRYLVEARRLDEALRYARACRAEAWWCAALVGFVHHYSADPAAADSAFDASLAAMEESERERWLDLSMILDERSIRTYRRLPDADRPAFEERFWRLSDPLLTRPGNELRSEHLARHVWDQFQYRAQSTDGISWGWDLREILIRYGWPTGWERTRDWGPTAGPPPLVSHYSSAPQYLLPPHETLVDASATAGSWEADEPRSRTGYNVPLTDSIARWFSPLAHQVAVFRRGDEAVVVAGYELPRDSVAEDAAVRAGLALLPTVDVLADPAVVLDEEGGVRGALMSIVPARPVLMSLEIVVPAERRIARARYGLDLDPVHPGLVALSDLLLFDADEALPDSLPDAIPIVRGSDRVQVGERIGIYWEIYGLDTRENPTIEMSIRLLEGRRGWLRRLAERAGLLREVAPIRLRWEEPTTDGPYMARSITVDVPEVAPGTYTLELTVDAAGREPLAVRRDLIVTEE